MPEQCSQVLCKKCGVAKPITDFQRHSEKRLGYFLGACKACINTRRLLARREKARTYAGTEAQHERFRRYRRENPSKAKRDSANRNPVKERARRILREAVRRGVVRKPANCQDCGAMVDSRKLGAHHSDYSKPLDVEWLCSLCHGVRHRIEAEVCHG
jgi:hypothetical protein